MSQQRWRRLVLLSVTALILAFLGNPATAAGGSRLKKVGNTTTTANAQTASSPPAVHTFPITKAGATLLAKYCGSGRVDEPNPYVRRLVVVVHGDSRNACDHATYVQQAASAAGVAASTLVVAPQFLTEADITSDDSSLLYWSNGGWKSGSLSLTKPYVRPWRTSSFAVTDLLIQQVTDQARFPNLTSVVVAGHSAGGQFTNRYAASSRVGAEIALGPSYRYVVANPSSYLYLDDRRYHSDVLAPLSADEVSACPGYNEYKYGLESPYAYLRENDVSLIPERYRARLVVYLLGDADTSRSGSLDTSCEADWQGANRLKRGSKFYRYLGEVYGSNVYTSHSKSIVPGVGHDAEAMYTSTEGAAALFP